jgi:hypothetical protein
LGKKLGVSQEFGELLRNLFFTSFGDVEIYVSGRIVVSVAKALHDFFEGSPCFGEQ